MKRKNAGTFKSNEASSFSDNRFSKQGHDVGQESATENESSEKQWSFRDEISASSPVEKEEGLKLVCEEGLRAALKAGLAVSRCMHTRLTLLRPILREDNCRDILAFIPGVSQLKTHTRYILGYDNFSLDRVLNEISYDMFVVENPLKPRPLAVFPDVGTRVIFKYPYYATTLTLTPAWILKEVDS